MFMPYNPGELDALRERCESAATLNIRRYFQFSMRLLLALPVIAGTYIGFYEMPYVRRGKWHQDTAARLEKSGHIGGVGGTASTDWWRVSMLPIFNVSDLRIFNLIFDGSADIPSLQLDQIDTLRSLALTNPSNADLQSIRDCTSLQALHIAGWSNSPDQVTDLGLTYLSLMKELMILEFLDVRITDTGVETIVKDHPHLRTLDLSKSAITDEGLRTIASLRDLESLELYATTVTDDGVSDALPHLEDLNLLDLEGTPITGEGLQHAPSTLRNLDVSFTHFSPEYLPHITTLPNLEYLTMYDLDGTNWTLDHIRQLTHIKNVGISLYNPPFSAAQVATFMVTHPNVEIEILRQPSGELPCYRHAEDSQ